MFEFYRFGRFIFALQKAQIFCLDSLVHFWPMLYYRHLFSCHVLRFSPLLVGKHTHEMFKGLFYGPVIRMLDFSG